MIVPLCEQKTSSVLYVHCANDGLSGYVRQFSTEESLSQPVYTLTRCDPLS